MTGLFDNDSTRSPEGQKLRRVLQQIQDAHRPGDLAGPAGDDLAAWRAFGKHRYDRRRRLGWSREKALAGAWNDMVSTWHRRYSTRHDLDHCAGCGLPVDTAAMHLEDGVRIHRTADLECFAAYGERWRSSCSASLVMLGLKGLPQ